VTCKGVGRVGVPVDVSAIDGVPEVSPVVCAGLAGEFVVVIGKDGVAVSSGKQADAMRTAGRRTKNWAVIVFR
jgi:hypothetical protein